MFVFVFVFVFVYVLFTMWCRQMCTVYQHALERRNVVTKKRRIQMQRAVRADGEVSLWDPSRGGMIVVSNTSLGILVLDDSSIYTNICPGTVEDSGQHQHHQHDSSL